MFRTRQAPSPTGYLHFGTARTMLFTKLMAIANQGIWYLRIEDTDRNRLQEDAVTNMLTAMQNLSLLPDEGVTNSPIEPSQTADEIYNVYQNGEFGPYIQSHRLKIYHEHAQKLIDKKLAYWSYFSEKEKEELVEIKKVTKKAINYYKITTQKYSEKDMYASVENALSDPRKPALKYKLQRDQKVECFDELMGKTVFDLNLEEDFNILKSDGFPTYHLGHLVDDNLMQTSLVIRAQEWYPSLAKHVTMFADYWGEVPKYLHLPFIMGQTGTKKMSKRDGNVNMKDWLDKGYLPEAIINYLAFLGWNPGTEKELYLDQSDFDIYNNPDLAGKTFEEIKAFRMNKLMKNLAADFGIEKIQKAPARFNLDKLNWFNREYIKLMTLEEFQFRIDQHSFSRVYPEKIFRRGEYAYLVDFEKQLVYGNPLDPTNLEVSHGKDGQFYPIGGGKDEGETPLQTLKREIFEESEGQLTINPEDALHLETLNILSPNQWEYDGLWDGKCMNIWVCQTSQNQIDNKTIKDGGTFEFKWVDLADIIETNSYITYPIWKQFCTKNNLALFKPTTKILTYYAAGILDKNRIVTLQEKSLESNCVLNWQKPETTLITWKKSTTQESLQNLSQILDYIEVLSQELQPVQTEFYNSLFTSLAEKNHEELSKLWEEKIKLWLKENNKDVGAYLWPLRCSLSGLERSPSPFELLAILPIEEVKNRISQILS